MQDTDLKHKKFRKESHLSAEVRKNEIIFFVKYLGVFIYLLEPTNAGEKLL